MRISISKTDTKKACFVFQVNIWRIYRYYVWLVRIIYMYYVLLVRRIYKYYVWLVRRICRYYVWLMWRIYRYYCMVSAENIQLLCTVSAENIQVLCMVSVENIQVLCMISAENIEVLCMVSAENLDLISVKAGGFPVDAPFLLNSYGDSVKATSYQTVIGYFMNKYFLKQSLSIQEYVCQMIHYQKLNVLKIFFLNAHY